MFGLGESFVKSIEVGQSSDMISGLGSREGFVGEQPFFQKGSCILKVKLYLKQSGVKSRGPLLFTPDC